MNDRTWGPSCKKREWKRKWPECRSLLEKKGLSLRFTLFLRGPWGPKECDRDRINLSFLKGIVINIGSSIRKRKRRAQMLMMHAMCFFLFHLILPQQVVYQMKERNLWACTIPLMTAVNSVRPLRKYDWPYGDSWTSCFFLTLWKRFSSSGIIDSLSSSKK